MINEAEKVIEDYERKEEKHDGLIYMMYRSDHENVVPMYIGKSEKYGENSRNLSENILTISTNKDKFCRWGYNYAYHISDLSALICPGHDPEKRKMKYSKWDSRLFKQFPFQYPVLNFPMYFWMKAWEKGSVGIWKEFGPTSITFLEYLLIGVASDLFPEDLLNEEGVNRC